MEQNKTDAQENNPDTQENNTDTQENNPDTQENNTDTQENSDNSETNAQLALILAMSKENQKLDRGQYPVPPSFASLSESKQLQAHFLREALHNYHIWASIRPPYTFGGETYTSGFDFKLTRSITRHDFVRLCKRISQQLADHYLYAPNSFVLEPERICEGGIFWAAWPGKPTDKLHYKSMRFGGAPIQVNKQVQMTILHWPFIRDGVMDIWMSEADRELFPPGKYHTFLKSFYGAPLWTKDEINIFAGVLRKDAGAQVSCLSKIKYKGRNINGWQFSKPGLAKRQRTK